MRRFGIIFILLALTIGAASAQEPADRARETEIAAAAAALNALTADLNDNGADNPASFETDVRALIAGSRDRLGPVEASLKRAEDQLALLGPAPKEGEPAEAAPVARERAAINTEITFLRGQRTRIIANIDAATALLDDYAAQRLGERYQRVLRRGPSLTAPALWAEAGSQAASLNSAVGRYFSAWRSEQQKSGGILWSLAGLIAAFVLSLMMIGPISRWMRRAISARIEANGPTPARRVAVAGVKMLTRLIPGIAGGLLIIETARAFGLVSEIALPAIRAIWRALIAYLLVDGFARGLFAPFAPTWRLADVVSARTRYAFRLLLWIVIVVGVKFVLTTIVSQNAAALQTVITGAAAMIVGALVFALSRRSVWVQAPPESGNDTLTSNPAAEDASSGKRGNGPWGVIRFGGRLLAFVMLAAPIAGYVSIADFAATRLYYLTLLLTVLWFVRASLKEMTAWADQRLRSDRSGKPGQDDKQAFQFWIGAGIDFVLALVLTPLLFILAGVNVSVVRDYILRAFVGFRIGNVTLSLVDVLTAIGVFVGILALTRLFQSAMQRGPFAHSRIDPGIQNSLTTLLGYVGLVLAAIVGLGMLGVNLSNLALIAGALSVGIGFGLQSIVNNFVSGIILLFERPVRAGDWVVTASGEGVVKKISVRSTVIETFDRASVIIPNSELIASSVTNWTHKSALGRIRVPVGVAYSSDPELVREVLLKCANEHPLVVRYPEPFVVWQDFGDSSLNFDLRAYIADIYKGLQVRTDLRFAIFKAFRAQGIEFPFPAQDIFIRSLPAETAKVLSPKNPPPKKEDQPRKTPDEIDAPDD
jgi:small-conductance mechanosensitive channel